jgi:hypothetical protein
VTRIATAPPPDPVTPNNVRAGAVLARIFALTCAAVCLYAMRRADPDFWGYLSYGRLFIERGLTTEDPFAYTSQPFHWVTFEYGAHLILWLSYYYGGALGLIALKALVGGATLYFVYRTFRLFSSDLATWLPVFLLCASGISRFFLFRPQLFTFVFFALFVLVLFRHIRGREARLWMLPIATLLWANTHGGFIAGLGAIGLAILLQMSDGKKTRALWMTLCASAAASFVNPLGARIWVYVVTEVTHGSNRRYIREWQPASFSNDPWSTTILILLTVLLAVMAAASFRKLESEDGPSPMAWTLSCVPLLAMSYLSVRHVPLAAIWTGPIVAMLAAGLPARGDERAMMRRVWFVLRAVAIVPACLTFAVVYAYPDPAIRTDGPVLGRTHPCRAISYLRSAGIRGRMYNPLWWGSYITWNLYPDIRVSMDGRNISLYSDAMVVENMKFYRDPAETIDIGAPLRYDSDLLLVPTDSAVLRRVADDDRWRQIYRDSDAVLFARSDRPLSATVAAPASTPQLTICSPVLQ